MDRTKERNRTYGTTVGIGLLAGAGGGVLLGALGLVPLAIGVGVCAGLGLVAGAAVGMLRSGGR